MSRPMRSDQWVEWLEPPPITGDRSGETVRLSIGKDFFFNFIQHYQAQQSRTFQQTIVESRRSAEEGHQQVGNHLLTHAEKGVELSFYGSYKYLQIVADNCKKQLLSNFNFIIMGALVKVAVAIFYNCLRPVSNLNSHVQNRSSSNL